LFQFHVLRDFERQILVANEALQSEHLCEPRLSLGSLKLSQQRFVFELHSN
jgi:hypothetical protein